MCAIRSWRPALEAARLWHTSSQSSTELSRKSLWIKEKMALLSWLYVQPDSCACRDRSKCSDVWRDSHSLFQAVSTEARRPTMRNPDWEKAQIFYSVHLEECSTIYKTPSHLSWQTWRLWCSNKPTVPSTWASNKQSTKSYKSSSRNYHSHTSTRSSFQHISTPKSATCYKSLRCPMPSSSVSTTKWAWTNSSTTKIQKSTPPASLNNNMSCWVRMRRFHLCWHTLGCLKIVRFWSLSAPLMRSNSLTICWIISSIGTPMVSRLIPVLRPGLSIKSMEISTRNFAPKLIWSSELPRYQYSLS